MATELRRERREKQKRQRQREPQKRRGSGGITNQLVIGGFVLGALALAFFGRQHYNQAGLAPATWGIKDSNLPNEVTTHNLEHGGIVIGYNNLTPAETDQLKGIVRALMNGTYRKIILEPYPLTNAKVALTSWGWLLNLQSVDQIQIVQFTRSHYSDPNFAPEPNVQ